MMTLPSWVRSARSTPDRSSSSLLRAMIRHTRLGLTGAKPRARSARFNNAVIRRYPQVGRLATNARMRARTAASWALQQPRRGFALPFNRSAGSNARPPMSLQLSSWRTVPFQRLRKPGLFLCAALFQRFLQDFVFKHLTTRLAFQLANARFPVPHGLIDGDAVVFCHGDIAFFEHEPSSTIHKIGSNTIAARNGGDAFSLKQGLFHNPQLIRCRPATTATAISNDFNPGHEHMPKDMLKPPWSDQGVRAKQEPAQSILAMQAQTKQEKINKPPSYSPTPLEG